MLSALRRVAPAAARSFAAYTPARTWQVYLSGEIHSDWREVIAAGVADRKLPVELGAPITSHEDSDDCGAVILGDEASRPNYDGKGARLNLIRARTGRQARATFPTSKAPSSTVVRSFRPILGRAIISRSALDAWMFLERARAERSCRSEIGAPGSRQARGRSSTRRTSSSSASATSTASGTRPSTRATRRPGARPS